jgi:hypothetical protein
MRNKKNTALTLVRESDIQVKERDKHIREKALKNCIEKRKIID